MASESWSQTFPSSYRRHELEGSVHIHILVYHPTRSESWNIKHTLSCIFRSHVILALVPQEPKDNIYIKTGIRIVITRPFSNLPELPRGVIMRHFTLKSINDGRKRLTVRTQAVNFTHLRSIEVSLRFYFNGSRTGHKARWISWDIDSSKLIISYFSRNLNAIKCFLYQKTWVLTLYQFLYSSKWTDAPYNSSRTVSGEHVLENDIDESSSDIGARFQ
jgi:hypothetical protein